MKAKKNISIEEQLRVAAAGAATEGRSNFKNIIEVDGKPSQEEIKKEQPVNIPPTFSTITTPNFKDPQGVPSIPPHQPTPPQQQPTFTQQPQNNNNNNNNLINFERKEQPQINIEPAKNTERVEGFIQKAEESYPERIITEERYNQNSTYNGNLNTNNVSMIIEMSDIYRGLDNQVQEVIKRFIRVEKGLTSNKPHDLSAIIIGIINVSQREKDGLRDLISLKTEERTSRAFSMVALDDNRLEAVQDLVVLFNSSYNPNQNANLRSNKILFCRELEIGIDLLSTNTLDLLKPIDKLFSIMR